MPYHPFAANNTHGFDKSLFELTTGDSRKCEQVMHRASPPLKGPEAATEGSQATAALGAPCAAEWHKNAQRSEISGRTSVQYRGVQRAVSEHSFDAPGWRNSCPGPGRIAIVLLVVVV